MDIYASLFGDEITDASQETFELFSQSCPLPNLGMLDQEAELLEVVVGQRDFSVRQSPGLLQSQRDGGTTGAAVWQVSIRFAEWIQWPNNPLLKHGIIGHDATVLELGAGISGIVPCVLIHECRKVVATDQPYVLKILRENIDNNNNAAALVRPVRSRSQRKARQQRQTTASSNVDVLALDWEHDDVQSVLSNHGLEHGVDCVMACDCIYNYALIAPFVQTCVDIARLRVPTEADDEKADRRTWVVVAQQLRQAEVFEQWLEAFSRSFRVWRVPHDMLSAGLKEGNGFVVHMGLLRDG